jgi:transposase
MFPRIANYTKKNKSYEYLVISESIRKKGKSTIVNIASLGNIKRFKNVDIEAIIDGLIKIFQLEKYSLSEMVEIIESLEHGSIIFWQKFWKDLQLSKLIRKQLAYSHPSVKIAVEKYVEIMTVNRCIKPDSKLSVTRWLETTSYKRMKGYTDLNKDVTYFYRSMDYLLKMKEALELAIFERMKNLFSVNVNLTFYDITSTFFYTKNCSIADLGHSRDDRPACEQIVIGVVTSHEGYPIKHYVFEGNTVDNTTIKKVISDLKKDYSINETIFVGDRGMITKLNIKEIENKGFDYIMGVKMHQNELCQMLFVKDEVDWDEAENYRDLKILEKRIDVKEFLQWKLREVLRVDGVLFSDETFTECDNWIQLLTNDIEPDFKEVRQILKNSIAGIDSKICSKMVAVIKRYQKRYENEYRFIICLNQERRQAARQKRKDYIERFSNELDKIFSGNKEQTIVKIEKSINKIFTGYKSKYRKFFDIQREEETSRAISYSLNKRMVEFEEKFDGVFTLSTNRYDIENYKVVESYKNLQEVEILFDDLKNFVDIRPIRHWLPKRVRSHVFICILALLLKRVFEINYLGGKSVTEPLEEINSVKLARYKVKYSEREDRHQVIPKVTNVSPKQKEYFDMIGLKNPANLENFLW